MHRGLVAVGLIFSLLPAPAGAQGDWCTSLGLALARGSVRSLEATIDSLPRDLTERAEYEIALSAARTCVSYLETLEAAGIDPAGAAGDPEAPTASALDLIRRAPGMAPGEAEPGVPLVPVRLEPIPDVGAPQLRGIVQYDG